MTELELKYGCNPNQKPSRIFMEEGALPLEVLNGKPGYINFMDALNSWQLVKALKKATGLPAAASFKHVSPAGAALGLPLTDTERKMYLAPEGDFSPTASAPLGTGRPSPTPATPTLPGTWPWRSPTGLSPRTTPRRPWRSSARSERAATAW